jgi:hypothetical protein
VALAARLAEVDLDDFKALNPSMNRPVILAAGTPQILLPWDNAATVLFLPSRSAAPRAQARTAAPAAGARTPARPSTTKGAPRTSSPSTKAAAKPAAKAKR